MPKTPGQSKRRKDSDSVENFSYKFAPPRWTPTQLVELQRAAHMHAQRNPSDPFAFGRMLTHLKRGLANVADVIADNKAAA